ncbi:MAG: hypothetical protein INR62_06335 [Rhodospirillales bacterium]|nr:hypothetical protein [Acetobacter sp.]
MTDAEITQALAVIQTEEDASLKNYRVAALLSELFRAQGADPILVGGSAVEVYTEGRYVSGDVDLCFAGAVLPKPLQRAAVMARVGAQVLSSHKFVLAGVYVDLLGPVETGARTPFQQIGPVKLIPLEDLVAERVFVAYAFPAYDAGREAVAKALLQVALHGGLALDQAELRRLAQVDYGVGAHLERLLQELATPSSSATPPTLPPPRSR